MSLSTRQSTEFEPSFCSSAGGFTTSQAQCSLAVQHKILTRLLGEAVGISTVFSLNCNTGIWNRLYAASYAKLALLVKCRYIFCWGPGSGAKMRKKPPYSEPTNQIKTEESPNTKNTSIETADTTSIVRRSNTGNTDRHNGGKTGRL